MAYGADDYNALILWGRDYSAAVAQNKFSVNSSLTPSDIADALNTRLAAGGLNSPTFYMNNHVVLKQIEIFSLELSGAVFIKSDTTAGGQQGTGASTVNACMVTTFNGVLPGRKHRNRVYWPFIDDGFVIEGGARWDTDFGESAFLSWPNLKAALLADGVTMKIQNKKDQVLEDLVAFRVNTYIGSQRRRAERFE